jgi:hypothetical protein
MPILEEYIDEKRVKYFAHNNFELLLQCYVYIDKNGIDITKLFLTSPEEIFFMQIENEPLPTFFFSLFKELKKLKEKINSDKIIEILKSKNKDISFYQEVDKKVLLEDLSQLNAINEKNNLDKNMLSQVNNIWAANQNNEGVEEYYKNILLALTEKNKYYVEENINPALKIIRNTVNQ